MTRSLRSIADLAAAGLARPSPALEAVAARYAVAITPDMAALIDRDDPDDPIARQFVPDARELLVTAAERADPIGDETYTPVNGIVHRYPDRVLLKPLLVCPVYCRFCFRREVVGPGGDALDASELAAAFAYIRTHPAIWEVILTGGDPLMLAPRRLREIADALSAIDHVRVVRWHSRVPIVDPARITPEAVEAIARARPAVWLSVHVNHPRELGPAAAAAIRRLGDAGIVLVSQTVLLRGVNDDAAVLEELMRRLVELRVRPYYLHQADLAPGTAHFRTTIAEGQAIMRALRGRLSGIAQPTFVLDIPGGFGKVPAGPGYLEEAADGSLRVTDPSGAEHDYRA